MEIIISVIAGSAVLIAICIITITVRYKCQKQRQPSQDSYPHFDASTIGPNYGYASAKAYQRSSLACTYKTGIDENTNIWETPLPQPSARMDVEYTQPTNMRQQYQQDINQGQPQMEYTLPANMRHLQSPHPALCDIQPASDQARPTSMRYIPSTMENSSMSVEYTMPMKVRKPQQDVHVIEQSFASSTSDYTLPTQSQRMLDDAEPESDYTMPTGMNIPEEQKRDNEHQSTLSRIL